MLDIHVGNRFGCAIMANTNIGLSYREFKHNDRRVFTSLLAYEGREKHDIFDYFDDSLTSGLWKTSYLKYKYRNKIISVFFIHVYAILFIINSKVRYFR